MSHWPKPAFVCFLLLSASGVRAGSLDDAGRELARKFSAGGKIAATLSVRNLTSTAAQDIDDLRGVLELEFAGEAAAELRVTVSENLQQLVLVGELRKGEDLRVEIVTRTKQAAVSQKEAETAVAVELRLLRRQNDAMLDVAVQGGSLLVLEPGRLVVSEQYAERVLPLAAAVPSRDLRGRLDVETGTVRIWLPGVACQGSAAGGADLDCAASDEAWAPGLRFTLGRNSFEPWLQAPAFYSYAATANGTLFAGTDGRTWLFDSASTPASWTGWGTELATVQSACGAFILASPPGGDQLRAYRMAGRQPAPASTPSDLNGTLTALWTHGDRTVAIVNDGKTGGYAAYAVAVDCSR